MRDLQLDTVPRQAPGPVASRHDAEGRTDAPVSARIGKLLVVDGVRHGPEHTAFNASSLLACRHALPGTAITFLAESGHIEKIRGLLPESARIELGAISVPPRYAGKVRRFNADWELARTICGSAAAGGADRVLLTSTTESLLWAFRALRLRHPLPPILSIVHSSLIRAVRRPRYNYLARLLSYRTAILQSPPELRFAVLEDSILEELQQHDAKLARRFLVVRHPVPPDLLEAPALEPRADGSPWKIGLLGLATPQKGLFRFLQLAKEAAEAGLNVEFHLVGRLHPDFVDAARPYLHYLHGQPETHVMPRAQYVRRLRELDFAAFLLTGSRYRFTASGVLLDCIALGIPLLHVSPPLLRSLEAHGAVPGLACPAGEELATLQRLRNLDADAHLRMRERMLSARARRMPAEVGSQLADLLAID